jgi:peptidoglycan/LPS O-acetylase OafA/YrhL
MIVLAVGLRLYFSVAGFSWITPYVLMPTCLDSFGLGGLMAYFFTFHQDDIFQKLAKTRYVWLLLVVLVGYFAVNRIAFENPHNWFSDTFERLLGSAFCFFLIANAVKGYSGAMQTFLQNGIVSYLGRISYGLYLYHNFVFNHFHTPPTHITYRILHKAERILPFLKDNLAFQLCLFWGLTIVVATISWYLIEKPVNDLKKYFKY